MNLFFIHITAILTSLLFDCEQYATGVVLDKETRSPIKYTSIRQAVKEDKVNSYLMRVYTDSNGHFVYHRKSAQLGKCPDLVLYFSRQGYNSTTMTFTQTSSSDTVLLERSTFDPNISVRISLTDFKKQVKDCINLLKVKKLREISDKQHIVIMMCLNTIFMRDFKGGNYDKLRHLSEAKNYSEDITNLYPENIPNRGMGYYFFDLQMELYGTPRPYAVYNVQR